MKHKFIFVRNVSRINHDSVIFHVWIHESQRGEYYKQCLVEAAASMDAWFQKWSECVDARLDYYEERVFWRAPQALTQFRVRHIEAAQLVAAIHSGNIEALEKSVSLPKNFLRLFSMFYPASAPVPQSLKKRSSMLTSPRKNLSMRRGSEVRDAVIGMVGVAVLYFLGMIVEAIERVCL